MTKTSAADTASLVPSEIPVIAALVNMLNPLLKAPRGSSSGSTEDDDCGV